MSRPRDIRRWRSHDYYAVLGVAANCSAMDVKRGFRTVALTCHPDKVPPEEREQATKRFQLLAEAYEVLSREDMRRQYDEARGKRPLPFAKMPSAAGPVAGAHASAKAGQWSWPAWCLSGKPPGIEVLVTDDDGRTVWVQATPKERIVDPKTGQDTHINADYRWDKDTYNEDFGPDCMRRCGEVSTVADEFNKQKAGAEMPKDMPQNCPREPDRRQEPRKQRDSAKADNQGAPDEPTRTASSSNDAQKVLDKLDILMTMGFDEPRARSALARCSSVEAAVEYLMTTRVEDVQAGAEGGQAGFTDYVASAAKAMHDVFQPVARQYFTADTHENGKVQQLVSNLLELGFSDKQARAAAERCSSVEASVEWLSNHS